MKAAIVDIKIIVICMGKELKERRNSKVCVSNRESNFFD